MSTPFLIVGLGNPGARYAETRHNAGFWFLDRVAAQSGARLRLQSKLQAEVARVTLHGHDCLLARPVTFMNHSGQAVRAVMDYYAAGAESVLVAYDELDLPPGVARLKQGGGHGGHNGLRDIFRHTADHNFLRLRIGIGHPGTRDAVTGYVLSRANAEQERLIFSALDRALAVLPDLLDGDLADAMKELHTMNEDGIGANGL
ncbi:MAG: aminoacyl-tRNA hydrolase [Lysobacterales bacterium]|jgi:PTH1 family peptidyl-tRNA hydrolase|nr:MAG: aminoacyl-tRNA hydrolase [Xanthomonadales bacterium]